MPTTLLQDARASLALQAVVSLDPISLTWLCPQHLHAAPVPWGAVSDKQECFPWGQPPVINSWLTPETSSKLQHEWCLLGHRIKVTDSIWGIFCLTPLTIKLRDGRPFLPLDLWDGIKSTTGSRTCDTQGGGAMKEIICLASTQGEGKMKYKCQRKGVSLDNTKPVPGSKIVQHCFIYKLHKGLQ